MNNKILWAVIGLIIVFGIAIGFYLTQQSQAPSVPSQTTASSTPAQPKVAGPGERCGGNFLPAPICQTGYHCAPEPGSHLPFGDVGGICVVN